MCWEMRMAVLGTVKVGALENLNFWWISFWNIILLCFHEKIFSDTGKVSNLLKNYICIFYVLTLRFPSENLICPLKTV